jgi:hypothetical protein
MSRGRPLLRWLLPGFLALLLACSWALLLSGGDLGLTAWWILVGLLPPVALLALLPTLLYAAWKRRLGPARLATLLLGLFALWPGAWALGVAEIRYPGSIANAQPPVTVRLPSDLPLRVLWGGDALRTNHHASAPDQRWAYDLVIEPAMNNSSRLQDYGCWGTPVLAPAAARVHLTHDGQPEGTPGSVPSTAQAFGNFVSLELESGTYLVLAHLQPGSVSVHAGERVSEGQPIGRCGNSGHSSEPHIHIHHQRQPLDPDHPGVAEGLPLYFRDSDGPAMPEGGVTVENGHVVLQGAVVRHRSSR